MSLEGAGKKLKEELMKGMKFPLKMLPLWVEAIGAGAFISNIVENNPGFKEKLKQLDGKVFMFEATDVGRRFYLHMKGGDIKVVAHTLRPADVVMRGEVKVLVEVLLGKVDPDTVFFSRRLEINGDTASAILFKNMLAALG